MSRNDGSLYTGATSASFTSKVDDEVQERKLLGKQERLEKKHKLKPAAEPVLELIEKHKAKVINITEFAVETMITDEHFKAEVMARKKFYQFLVQFESEIKVVLKEQS